MLFEQRGSADAGWATQNVISSQHLWSFRVHVRPCGSCPAVIATIVEKRQQTSDQGEADVLNLKRETPKTTTAAQKKEAPIGASFLVPRAGLEPARPKAQPPEDCASTNFATWVGGPSALAGFGGPKIKPKLLSPTCVAASRQLERRRANVIAQRSVCLFDGVEAAEDVGAIVEATRFEDAHGNQ